MVWLDVTSVDVEAFWVAEGFPCTYVSSFIAGSASVGTYLLKIGVEVAGATLLQEKANLE